MHKLLWFCLLGLTIAIILWPVSPSPLDPMPVQSIYAIKELLWFIVLFYAWAVVLATLLFLVKGSTLERLALCLVFSLVFVQFWAFVTPWGMSDDGAWLIGHLNYLLERGHLPAGGHPHLAYFDFPGLSIIGAMMSHATGADIFFTAILFTTISGIVLTVILYAAFHRLTGTPYRAALSVILAIASSSVLGSSFGSGNNQFLPHNLSTLYIAVFLLLLAMFPLSAPVRYGTRILFLVLIFGAVIGHVFPPYFFLMVLLAGYLYRISSPSSYISPTLIFLIIVSALSWEIFLTVTNFDSLVRDLPRSLSRFYRLDWLYPTASALQVTLDFPMWGTLARLFWWLGVYVFGGLLLLGRLPSFRTTSAGEKVVLIVLVGTLASAGTTAMGYWDVVHAAFTRYIGIGSLSLAPFIVDMFSRLKAKAPAAAFAALGLVFLLPTMLTNADDLSTQVVYKQEVVTAEFLSSLYGQGEGLTLYGIPATIATFYIYLPNAHGVRGGPYLYRYVDSEHKAWQALDRTLVSFRNSYEEKNLLIFTEKEKAWYQVRYDVPLDHENWRLLLTRANSGGNRIYDNQQQIVFRPRQQN